MARITRSSIGTRGHPLNYYLYIQPEGGEPSPIFSGEVQRRFQSEFHSALRSLGAEDLPWIHLKTFKLTDRGKLRAQAIYKDLQPTFTNEIRAREDNQYLFSKMLTNLSRDLALISGAQVPASLDPLYAPILHKWARTEPASGFAALQVALPNASQLDWATILELREQESLVQFRQKMVALEQIVTAAVEAGAVDEANYQIALHQEMMDELLRELIAALPKWGAVVGDTVLDLLISPIPLAGTILSTMKGLANVDETRRSWITAFIRLRQIE